MFAFLLAGWGVGIWATMVRGSIYEVSGTYVARPDDMSILVRHDALPALDMKAMDVMAFSVVSKELIDRASLATGDRVRLVVRKRGDDLLVEQLGRAP